MQRFYVNSCDWCNLKPVDILHLFLFFVVFDATGKIPSGILLGNAQWLGTYGECVGVSSKQSKTQLPHNRTIQGQYCLMSIGDGSSVPDIQVRELLLIFL